MQIPSAETITTEEQARQLAIDWQQWASEQSLSWGESSLWSDFFSVLVAKFPGLEEEFKENGIL